MRSIGTVSAILAGLAATASAAHDGSFAVLRFHGQGPLTEGCVDPIVSPGGRSGHVHTVMGASNFDTTVSGESLMGSDCTNANVPGDNSAYWMPKLYFQDPETQKIEDVPLYYANVYYFFDKTDDDIVAFPQGLKIVAGDATARTAPAAGGDIVLDPEDAPDGIPQGAQWTCPRSTDEGGPTYPVDSDGTTAGIKNSSPSAKDFGTGFPVVKCDGLYSPLRADLHFPSCYNPEAGLDDWQNNMVYPSRKYEVDGSGLANCPPGYLHVPHLFFEYYWDTQAFSDRWEVDGQNQPFVLANGDRTGFSLHGDAALAWDSDILQTIIDTCDAGTVGMDTCISGLNVNSLPNCNIDSPVTDTITGVLDELPCGNSLYGWGVGDETTYEPMGDAETETDTEEDEVTVDSNSNAEVPEEEEEAASTTEAQAEEPATTAAEEPAETAEDEPEETEDNENQTPADTNENYGQSPASSSPPEVAEEPATTPAPEAPTSVVGGGAVYTEWITQAVTVTTTVYVDPSATSVSSSSAFSYVGCYSDSTARVMEHRGVHGQVTPEKCYNHCESRGYTLAGIEYGGECFCANSLVGSEEIDESSCSIPCEGDSEQTCGGSWALSLYSKTGEVALEKREIKRSRIFGHSHIHRRMHSHHF